ncbi:MAG: hypothetical protein WC610_00020 [Patescibacteria group bacterium]
MVHYNLKERKKYREQKKKDGTWSLVIGFDYLWFFCFSGNGGNPSVKNDNSL